MKKKVLLLAVMSISLSLGVAAGVVLTKTDNGLFATAKSDSYWFHYSQVTPTLTKHGSKEFWANCSTHNFVLEYPGSTEDIREGVAFDSTVYFDQLTSEDPRYLPPLGERVDIKGYLNDLVASFTHDPYSYIPDTMRPETTTKVTEEEVTYDFANFTSVSSIKYGGYGEQWHMVIENIRESERFYNVTTIGSEIITATNFIVYSFLDDYYDGTISKTFTNGSSSTATLNFGGSTLTYAIQFDSGIEIPLFGTVTPQISMEYVIGENTKTVRIQLSENNAMKFVITPNSYTFGLEYGIETVSRKAYFTISKDEEDAVEGHIYEYVQYKGKDLVPACADFYIDEEYTTAIGNKASGLVGFDNYICELYKTSEGKLLGYEIQETKTISLVSVTFNTLWFNLNNITGINNVKISDNKVYVNNSTEEFKTKNFGGITKKTASRRYDIELRKQFFYGEVEESIKEYETSIPMMFVQEEKLSDFASDVNGENPYLNVAINLLSAYLTKIQNNYSSLVPVFIEGKGSMTGDMISTFINNPFESGMPSESEWNYALSFVNQNATIDTNIVSNDPKVGPRLLSVTELLSDGSFRSNINYYGADYDNFRYTYLKNDIGHNKWTILREQNDGTYNKAEYSKQNYSWFNMVDNLGDMVPLGTFRRYCPYDAEKLTYDPSTNSFSVTYDFGGSNLVSEFIFNYDKTLKFASMVVNDYYYGITVYNRGTTSFEFPSA